MSFFSSRMKEEIFLLAQSKVICVFITREKKQNLFSFSITFFDFFFFVKDYALKVLLGCFSVDDSSEKVLECTKMYFKPLWCTFAHCCMF
jgi:hypothetical protein